MYTAGHMEKVKRNFRRTTAAPYVSKSGTMMGPDSALDPNWLIGKKSHLSIQNKLLIYKAVIKPIWSYGIELWGCGSKSNIVVTQRSQYKILRAIRNALRYVRNHTLHTDSNITCVSDIIHERINKYPNNLEAHPNPLLEPLLQPINTRRLKRCWPLDL